MIYVPCACTAVPPRLHAAHDAAPGAGALLGAWTTRIVIDLLWRFPARALSAYCSAVRAATGARDREGVRAPHGHGQGHARRVAPARTPAPPTPRAMHLDIVCTYCSAYSSATQENKDKGTQHTQNPRTGA